MARTILDYTDPAGTTWRVEQLFPLTRPGLVRFVHMGRMRKLLDQTAELTPDGWSAKRWQPHRRVPLWMRQAVQRRLWDENEVLR